MLFDNVDFHTRENKSEKNCLNIELMHSCCLRKMVEGHSDDWVLNRNCTLNWNIPNEAIYREKIMSDEKYGMLINGITQ